MELVCLHTMAGFIANRKYGMPDNKFKFIMGSYLAYGKAALLNDKQQQHCIMSAVNS